MPVRRVVRLPERVLKKTADEVGGAPDPGLVADLIDTMKASPACVGLAAPQIGVSQKVFVADVSGHPKAGVSHGVIVLADPVVVTESGRHVGREGCMSVPDLTANVVRAESIMVAGWGPDGSSVTVETSGFEARALQHEIDHLSGTLILDRVTSLTTDVFARRVYR